MTLTAFLDAWVSGSAGRVCSARWEKDRRYWLSRLIAIVGDVDLDTLTPAHVWAAQRQMRELRLAASTVNHVTFAAVAAIRDAEAMGVLREGSHKRFLALIHRDREIPEPVFAPWTMAEREALLAAADRAIAPTLAKLVYWQFLTGMRISETIALRRGDVDFENRVAFVRRSRSKNVEGRAKTAKSIRAVPLPTRLVEKMEGEEWPSDESPLFQTPVGRRHRDGIGKPINEANFARRAWQRVLEAAGEAVRPMAFRSTRHTYVSLALEAGMPPADIAAVIGDNVATMLRHYQRFTRPVTTIDVDRATAAPIQLTPDPPKQRGMDAANVLDFAAHRARVVANRQAAKMRREGV